jgi:hypothetical protein
LLHHDAKQQFIAERLFDLRGAKRVAGVEIESVRENPRDVASGLARIWGLYDMEGLTAESVVREVGIYLRLRR